MSPSASSGAGQGGVGPTELSLEAWAERIVALPKPLLLAFDVDGTLAPIVVDPAKARVPAPVLRPLQRLAEVPGVCLAFITGRDYGALRRMVPISGSYRAVEHGAVVLAPGTVARPGDPDPAALVRLNRFERWMQERAQPLGAELERKRTSRAIHVRQLAKADERLALELLAEARQVAKDAGLVPRDGRGLVEAELRVGDKGVALGQILRRSGARSVVFAGDDLTDMPALSRAVEAGGIGLFVRSDERPQAPEGVSGVVDGPEAMGQIVQQVAQHLLRRARDDRRLGSV